MLLKGRCKTQLPVVNSALKKNAENLTKNVTTIGLREHFERISLIRGVLRMDLNFYTNQSPISDETLLNHRFCDTDFKIDRNATEHAIFTAQGEKIAFLKYNIYRKQLREALFREDIDFVELSTLKHTYDDLRHMIASCYASLAHFATTKYESQRTRNATYEDEYEMCCLTLMRSIDLYNPALGFRFSTYVMKGMLTNLYSKVHSNRSNIMKVWNKTSSWDCEYGQETNISDYDWRKIDLKADCKDLVNYGFKNLTPNQQHVVIYRFGLGVTPRTLEEISQQLGVTRERVRQIESKAIRTLQLTCEKFREAIHD